MDGTKTNFSRDAHKLLDGEPGVYKLAAYGHGIKVAVRRVGKSGVTIKLLTVVKFGGKGKENAVLFNGHYDTADPAGSKRREVFLSYPRLRGMGTPILPVTAQNGHGEIVNLVEKIVHGAAEAQSWAEAEEEQK